MTKCKNCGQPLAKNDYQLLLEAFGFRKAPLLHVRFPLFRFKGTQYCVVALKKSKTGCLNPEPMEAEG